MSSAICKNFVQNAWKKELCSNCFKSKDEHSPSLKLKSVTLVSNVKIVGIIRDPKKSKQKLNVEFTKELSEFIGYGGEDWLSEDETKDEDIYDSEDINDDDLLTDSDEDDFIKEIRLQTKKNTNYNTVSLGEIIEEKKNYAHLMLGKPLVDSEGKKQTLLVSVTPFGEDSSKTYSNVVNCNNKNVSHLSGFTRNNKENGINEKNSKNSNLNSFNNKNDEESIIGVKEEKSLLDEISETLEKSKNPIQILDKKKPQQSVSNKENINNAQKDSDTLTKTERRISLTRTPALKNRDLEKPVVYQSSSAKIELLNSKNLKLNKESVSKDENLQEINNNNSKPETRLSKGDEKLFNDIISSSTFIKNEIQNSRENNSTSKAGEKKGLTSLQSQSREQAGKPDGREDPEAALELPALPATSPPPLETQSSFLHGSGGTLSGSSNNVSSTTNSYHPPLYEKPKIPSKPTVVLTRKPGMMVQNNGMVQSPPMTTFAKEPLTKQDSGSDMDPRLNKRKAPKPPEETLIINSTSVPNGISGPLFTRNSVVLTNGDSPVVREKEKKERNERASSCTPKMYSVNTAKNESDHYQVPAPTPRKSFSISTDNLTNTNDEKRKEKTKGRFSLRKFLRMGSSKDLPRMSGDSPTDDALDLPKPKPRLVIVHPTELNGSKVEVVTKPDKVDATNVDTIERVKSSKPPPPPRNYDNWKPPISSAPPPKSMEVINKQRALSRSSSSSSTNKSKSETVYANIGEVRSAMVPNKPVRTASMREREAQQQKQVQHKKNIYEPIGSGRIKSTENVYDYVNTQCNRSSSPSSDSSGKNSPKSKNLRLNKRSESSIDVSGEYFKYGNIPRSLSLTYCGSETESEIYSPYSFYGSESEVTEDDHDWIQNGRTHKLRSRKGRSIVHKNLEDNYGAVIVANHEALAQVLENIQQTIFIQPALRGLKLCSNLRLTDFTMKSGISPVTIGSRTFHQALWGAQHVTLMFSTGIVSTSSTMNLGTFNLNSVTDFSDLVSGELLPGKKEESNKFVQASIAVLPWLQIHTIETYSDYLKGKPSQDDTWKDSFFIMLQLVNALKMLQAQGIEELPLSLNSFVLCKDMDRDTHHRLCILQGMPPELMTLSSPEEKYASLCTCASKAMALLQPFSKTMGLIQSLLSNERSVSLTQVKAVLEFSLWGPSDVSLGSSVRERELTLQRWLDLQRATVLHGLVCARVQLTVYEECHLLFLVRSNARMMSDASMLIESNNLKYSHSSKA
ncbi:uncharacterized protein LOC115888854 [Sitophilus oryzae]|uniref:Uncharacterized protein LOC115888854 n=1 Tax=Sitophilus oryzae TaxID=7048 RepID=A0A6J2YMF5_SITOR|nr:uncharacterized protein LOC115888854 [Sitophilus oryzae]XP_030764575.1 uncharacterized protein LOC115888854 [Sitophilus oryzae]XP_030764576.1 uncharacterized protein LOC115888854 [Sitophilus oryzae]XP_030764577.1 uncharacterized protein LOC115888854 [Sitophilus oryzae]